MTQDSIVRALIKTKLDFGRLPSRIYTDFDNRILAGSVEKYANERGCQILGAPAGRQHQNGLVERAWQTITNMCRSYITQYKMPRKYWWWALRHAAQVVNMLPCSVDGIKTSPLELVFGVRPDYSILVPIFAVTYFRHLRDGARSRDGMESRVMQSILLGRSERADGYILYSPHTKEFYVSSECKIDQRSCTPTTFNLIYDGGIFFGLYDSSPVAQGVEPYPPGTTVFRTAEDGSKIPGAVTSVPLPSSAKCLPDSTSTSNFYSVKMKNGETILLSPDDMDIIMNYKAGTKPPVKFPRWIHKDGKVMMFHNNNYLKGYLDHDDDKGWTFQIRKRNGDLRWELSLPNLLMDHMSFIQEGILLPGWSNSTRQIVAAARHISAKGLHHLIAPKSLKIAFLETNVDRAIWLASYLEELQGLLRMQTFEVITSAKYHALVKEHGCVAIPTMNVFTIKYDGHGNPARAKSRIVVLGNLDTQEYTKGDVYAPVASHYAVRFLLYLAIRFNRPVKQGDCKNAFVQSPLNDIIVVRPPPGCPYSKPGSFWFLKKSLYGLKRAPRYWFNLINTVLKDCNLTPCAHEPCFYYGHPLSGEPPLYLVIYVDDFIYFSESPKVESHFEQTLPGKVVVDFMDVVDYFLGIRFDWDFSNKSNVKCKMIQEAYIESMGIKMGIANANRSPKMTPYRSGLPIDSIPSGDLPEDEQKEVTAIYRSYVGMLTWLAISTRPDICVAVSLLSSFQQRPSKQHIESARYVGRYLLSTQEKGINFVHANCSVTLEGYVHFPVDPDSPTAFADANWGPQDASHPSETNNKPITISSTRSICGFFVFLGGAPIQWKCFKEARNSHSSCEAEIKATDECVKAILAFRNLLGDINFDTSAPTTVYNDNRGAIDWAQTMSNKRMRHYNIRENCVREAIHEFFDVSLLHVPGKQNPSDLLTKEHKSDSVYIELRDLVVY